MNELKDLIWVEKYRPSKIEDLILRNKGQILKFLDNNATIPNFLFCSQKPGTGKTSLAKIIINMTDSDSLIINSSDERGIDTIREKVKRFASALSTNNKKRCVFLDEADGMTRQSQDSLRNLMETLSDNCFFIFTANDASKIIEAIRSRCIVINFENPNKNDITKRLTTICEKEDLKVEEAQLERLIDYNYPDIRSCINILQVWKTTGIIEFPEEKFMKFWKAIKAKDVTYIYAETYSGVFNILEYLRWNWEKLFENYETYGLDKTSRIAEQLAEVEKSHSLSANLEIIFINAMLQIMRLL